MPSCPKRGLEGAVAEAKLPGGGREKADFPDLEREDIRAVLAFAAERERRLVSIPPG